MQPSDLSNTSMADTENLDQMNRDRMDIRTPVIVYTTLIILTGIPGNGLVCYIYKPGKRRE